MGMHRQGEFSDLFPDGHTRVEPTVGLVGFSVLPGDIPREKATIGMAGLGRVSGTLQLSVC